MHSHTPTQPIKNTSKGIVTARKRSVRRLCFYTCLSVILFTGGGRGTCMEGMGHVAGGCMAGGSIHVRGASMAGGCMHGGGACMMGHAWRACHTRPPPDTTRYGPSLRGRYASYWNAFLFELFFHERSLLTIQLFNFPSYFVFTFLGCYGVCKK